MFLNAAITDVDGMRNLDLTTLRAFVAVAEAGGVTRAAGQLHLTQSAVSMQLKRLEEALDLALFDRTARRMNLTGPGEQLLSYARQMLRLNDEAVGRMTQDAFEGEISLGVPDDILYPAIPAVLNAFAREYPRMRVQLQSCNTRTLKDMFARGTCDLILTTEVEVGEGGETLVRLPLIWVGACGGSAWTGRPLRLTNSQTCIFRESAQARLDASGIPWEASVGSTSCRAAETAVAADLGVYAAIDRTLPLATEPVPAAAGLPDLPDQNINLYTAPTLHPDIAAALRRLLQKHYAKLDAPRPAPAPPHETKRKIAVNTPHFHE